ncbi:hypothetical protein [Nocardia fluminea]|uniref:YbaB/EbfC DNA-binding family protein n=1 Tax=Nocardia fluminea TaxID=134984 RepID=A0A2N3V594_9NOCA|nr:hypothetical protein [Nocardia fluminea]PKV76798.1 hypothetical protein ATK86_7201 [Nocardia fluminea]
MTSTTNSVDLLAFALSEQRMVMTDPTGSVTVELTADGSITGIRLSAAGHRMTPTMVAELIMSLHTAGLAQAQKAIESALSDGEVPTMPELDLSDTSAPPGSETPNPADSSLTAPTTIPILGHPSEPARLRPPQKSAPAEQTMEQPARDIVPTPPIPTVEGVVHATHTVMSALPPNPRSDPGRPSPVYTDDAADEDEYFRTLSVFEYDDHSPRG